MCLRFQFCTHQRVCVLHFLKKVKFVVPYCTIVHMQYKYQVTHKFVNKFADMRSLFNSCKVQQKVLNDL
jgi:hypothetical protein